MKTATGIGLIVVLASATPSAAFAAEKKVCVEVILKEGGNGPQKIAVRPVAGEPESYERGGGLLPLGQTPVGYLQRLFEHFITHEPGFETVADKCDERLRVELYPLREGWTAFARYSGTGREERVDQLYPDELSQFAERATLALLYNASIGTTINRDNVLRADSRKAVQRVEGTNHFVLGLGTQLRLGQFGTAQNDGSARVETRVFSPMVIASGYRGKFETWGIDAEAQIGFGTAKTSVRHNPEGGHVDFGGETGLALHFLRYLKPRDLASFYVGAGSTFELMWFTAARPVEFRTGDNRTTLFGGGLDVDLVWGWEFMRASAVQFFLQGELNLPAYAVQTEDDYAGKIDTWFPGMMLRLGMVF